MSAISLAPRRWLQKSSRDNMALSSSRDATKASIRAVSVAILDFLRLRTIRTFSDRRSSCALTEENQ
jgi:hypothetical protein